MALELNRTTILSLFCSILFFSSGAVASSGVTYHGRLLKPNGLPVTSNNVQFKVQIRTPSPSLCILFEEIHTRDLSLSAGVFSLTLNDPTATSLNHEPYNLDRVFQNRGVFTPDPSKCTGTNEYTPGPTDGRVLYVSFNDGTFADWEPLPSQAINFVPAAMESVTVGGHRPSNFFRVFDGTTLQTLDPWPIASYQKLLDLITNVSFSGGNASIGGNAAGFTGTLAGDVTGGQKTTRVEQIQGYPVAAGLPGNGQVLTWSHANSRWEAANPPSSATPVGAASGDLAGTYPGPVIAPNAVTATKISDGAITPAKLQDGSAPGQVFRYDGADWQFAKLNYRDLINNTSGSPWPVADCGAGQAIVWVSAADAFACQSISISSSNIVDGSIVTADLADGSVSTSKIQNNAVTDAKIAGVAVNKIESGTGLYLTYAPNNIACADGQVLKKTANGWECGTDNNAGGTVTSVTGTAPIAVATGTTTPVISLNNAGVTATHLASDAVTSAKILDGTIATADLANLAVTDAKIAGVAANKIESGTGIYLNYAPNNSACGTGEVLKKTTNGWECGTDNNAGGTVTNVTGSAPISVATGSTTPVISLNAAGVTATHLASDAVTSAKILDGTIATADLANLAVTDAKIADVAVNKISSGAGLYLTYAPNGTTCTPGQVLKWNNSRWECGADSNAGGTVTSITAGTGLTGGTISASGTIGLGTELTGVNALNSTGFVKRTGAGAYSTVASVDLDSTDVTGVLPVARGGTGAGTANGALTNLLPAQTGHAGKVLRTDGSLTSWVPMSTGTVTSVTGTAPINVATGTTTPVISLNASGVGTTHLADGAVTDVKIAGMAVNKISSAAGLYLTYAPNGTTCTPGQVLKWNNSRWECGADSNAGGTVTSVTSANTDISVTNTTTTPSLTLNAGTGANQILKLDGSSRIPAVDGSQVTNLNATNLTSGTVPAARLPATVVLDGGNTVGSTMTVGTNANQNLDLRTNSTTKMTILAGGNVGIGTATPAAKLEVSGQMLSKVYNAGSATSINWNNGNLQYTSANCGAMAFSNMLEGGAYTLIVTGATSGTCSFSQTAAPDTVAAGSFKFVPAIAPTVASRTTVFTFLRAGNLVYVSWIAGY